MHFMWRQCCDPQLLIRLYITSIEADLWSDRTIIESDETSGKEFKFIEDTMHDQV